MPQTRLESPFPFDISVLMGFIAINVHLASSCFLSWLAAVEKNSNDGANSPSPWGVWFPFTDLALQVEVQLNINCINCSTAHLSWESLFAPDYAKNRSCLVLSQARGFSFPLAANFLIWLFLPHGCLLTTSQQLLQTWSTLVCCRLLCSKDRAGVHRLPAGNLSCSSSWPLAWVRRWAEPRSLSRTFLSKKSSFALFELDNLSSPWLASEGYKWSRK